MVRVMVMAKILVNTSSSKKKKKKKKKKNEPNYSELNIIALSI